MLRDAPGVYAQRKWGGDIRISIRGSGIGNANHNRGLLIAQDGVPLNEADGYGDSQIGDPLTTRFLEVYRGGNALRFGGALLGGATNMVTVNGQTADFGARARLDGGSFGLHRENLQVAHNGGDWDLYAGVTNQGAEGERPQSRQSLQFAALNVGRRVGEDLEVRFILNGSSIEQQIPGTLTLAQFLQNPRQANAGNLANNYSRDQWGVRGSLRATWRINPNATLEVAGYGVWKDLNHPIFQVIDQQSRNWGGFARLNVDGRIAGLAADGYFGVWARRGDLDSNFYTNLAGASGAQQSRTLQNATALDVFGEGRVFVTEQLALTAGGTFGTTDRDYRSFAVPGAPATFNLAASRRYDWFAPRFGILWQDAAGTQVFANVTRSVEPPNFGSLSPTNAGFAPVEAQEAWTAELGARGRIGPFTFEATLYRAWLDKEMLQYTVAANIPASTFNAGRTIHQGFEGALDWRFAPNWRLRQTYTWSDFRFENDVQYADNRLPIVPQHFHRAELRYESPQGWFVAPSVEWSASDIWVDYRNTTRAPSYAIANLNMGWTVNRRISLFVDIRNLADKAYISNVQAAILANASTSAYWPGDGRSIFAGVTASF